MGRNEMLSRIVAGQSKMVVLTHGTDTMIETGKYLEVRLGKDSDKRVVLTGSFLPEKFKDSDADFNIGTALGALPHLPPGVYIAMQGRVFDDLDLDGGGSQGGDLLLHAVSNTGVHGG